MEAIVIRRKLKSILIIPTYMIITTVVSFQQGAFSEQGFVPIFILLVALSVAAFVIIEKMPMIRIDAQGVHYWLYKKHIPWDQIEGVTTEGLWHVFLRLKKNKANEEMRGNIFLRPIWCLANSGGVYLGTMGLEKDPKEIACIIRQRLEKGE